MNFASAYNYLLSLQNLRRQEYMATNKHAALHLQRLEFLLSLLDHPEKKIPHYIHVTGTSGKGSVCSYLHQILLANGKRVGSTASPHPHTILERWRVGRRIMRPVEFVRYVEILKPILDKYLRTTSLEPPSFFEITEAIGLLFFVEQRIEWAVMEVGCGGRYDSSNVIPNKDLAIITNIGLDHVGVIGNNKKEIAQEKAGIIKRGCWVLTNETNPQILPIFQKEIKKTKAQGLIRTKLKMVKNIQVNLSGTSFSYQGQEFHTPAPGIHQAHNAILAIGAAKILNIPENQIRTGLANTHQSLCLEITGQHPLVVSDGAHNPNKIKTTVQTIQQMFPDKTKIHLVIGFSADKNIKSMVRSLATLQPTSIACTRQTINPFRQTANPAELAKMFSCFCSSRLVNSFLDPHQALAWSRTQEQKNPGIILVTGSIFLSGELTMDTLG
ncbi:MAG TPA: Mur ligase family protein [Patescibacteria group bacterium]|nr:Mur ligase family protein [Patescibacteria group bacterium]